MWALTFFCCLVIGCQADYWSDRAEFIKNEESRAFGSKLELSAKETRVNKILMETKWKELKNAFKDPGQFPPARHFFEAKADIEKSEIFSIIHKMPKGGALHIHDVGICKLEYVIYNITYRDHLYGCIEDDNIKFIFANPPPKGDCWKSMKWLRHHAKNEDEFNQWLASKMTMVTDDPHNKYPHVNAAWQKFNSLFGTLTPMLTYRPIFFEYFYHALEEFYDDNVNYVEFRGTVPTLYGLSGQTYTAVETMGVLNDVANQFLKDHPDFLGIKYIYAPPRQIDDATMSTYIKNFWAMKRAYPDFLLGFDLVGQEDAGQPLTTFIKQLQTEFPDVKFFFHAGESNWNGMSTDMNLVDAVLLNTTRIGHGYALTKHPGVMKEVKRRGIGIEINPISNQVLALVADLRNHPANMLFARDYPVVISSDDPGLWGSTGLSYDFYEAFMGMASGSADLRMLKQLALNSFHYSGLSDEDKRMALVRWTYEWDKFLESI